VLSQDGHRSQRAAKACPERSRRVIDRGGLLTQIPWFQPGNIGQFMEIFRADLGAI
jgi:hypothetical protein